MIVGGGIFFVVLQHGLVCFSSLDIVPRTVGGMKQWKLLQRILTLV